MPNIRRKGIARTDFWLDKEERRVLQELQEQTNARSRTQVLRYILRAAALANGITPPQLFSPEGTKSDAWQIPGAGKALPKNKGTKNK